MGSRGEVTTQLCNLAVGRRGLASTSIPTAPPGKGVCVRRRMRESLASSLKLPGRTAFIHQPSFPLGILLVLLPCAYSRDKAASYLPNSRQQVPCFWTRPCGPWVTFPLPPLSPDRRCSFRTCRLAAFSPGPLKSLFKTHLRNV